MINLNELDEQQRVAVESLDGVLRVVAGAGTGKTRALTYRFANIVEKGIAKPNQILCITFTNKAAKEMRDRIRMLLDDSTLECRYISTFHSMCLKILRMYIGELGFDEKFTVIDSDDKKQIVRRIIKDDDLDINQTDAIEVIESLKSDVKFCSKLSHALRNDQNYVDNLISSIENIDDSQKAILRGYFAVQYMDNVLDFDDLLNLTLELLITKPYIREKLQGWFKYIMVDEFQDVSYREFSLVKLLMGEAHNLFVVGDPDQTIYTWRGADVNYMLKLDELLGVECKTILLTANYRSDAFIVNRSNRLISNNKNRIEKELKPVNKLRCDVTGKIFNSPREQAYYIRCEITELLNEGFSLGNIAILYRQHAISREIEEQLLQSGIPYRVYKGTAFYNRKEIKDTLALLRLMISSNSVDLFRVINEPRRGFGPTKVTQTQRRAKELGTNVVDYLNICEYEIKAPKAVKFVRSLLTVRQFVGEKRISDIVKYLLDISEYMDMLKEKDETDRIDNINSLIESIINYEESGENDPKDISAYLEQIALVSDTDGENSKNAVMLMTLHSSKGMEFDVVFMPSVCECILPHRKSMQSGIEEERRLAYVGMTRAKKMLYMTGYNGRSGWGDFVATSRFLDEVFGPHWNR